MLLTGIQDGRPVAEAAAAETDVWISGQNVSVVSLCETVTKQ